MKPRMVTAHLEMKTDATVAALRVFLEESVRGSFPDPPGTVLELTERPKVNPVTSRRRAPSGPAKKRARRKPK